MKVELGLDTLNVLDNGKIVAAFGLAMKRLMKDCVDRPGDERPRTVTLKAMVKPVPEEHGACELAHVEFEITDSVPTRLTRVYEVQVKASGASLFNPESPDNARQKTLDEAHE